MEMRIIYCDELELGGLDFELSSQAPIRPTSNFAALKKLRYYFFRCYIAVESHTDKCTNILETLNHDYRLRFLYHFCAIFAVQNEQFMFR